jgi:DNA-binding GntR family transcriptional regulator
MSDKVKKVIIERIREGVYRPGERLIELQLADEFQTSQAPVREALCKLESMRIVETVAYKGTRVREIGGQELEECLQIRAVLENLAAEQVAARVLEKITILREIAMETVEAAKMHDLRRYSLANLDFHRLIVEASGNRTLITLWDSLAPEVRMFASVRAHSNMLVPAANEHLEIVEAFIEGDNRFAGKLLRKHVDPARVETLVQPV